MSKFALEIKDLRKVYRPDKKLSRGEESLEVHALQGIDLQIEHGDYLAIMGPSGCGKSTLMQILGLLDRPSSGTILYDGQDISTLKDDELAELRSQKVGFIFQFFNLLARTSCIENVNLPMIYAGKNNFRARSVELLEKVGLEHRLDHKPHQLSGGQQQRVAIARALANNPKILFADEPTGNISSAQTDEILNEIEELNDNGVTVVLVTHEDEVAERAKRIIRIKDGKLVEDKRLRPIHYNQALAESNSSKQKVDVPKLNWKTMRENIRMSLVALSLNKLRTALATLGIVIGIASVVAMVAVGLGAKSAITDQLSSLGTNILTIYPKRANTSGGRTGSYEKFTLADLQSIRNKSKNNPRIQGVGAQLYGNVSVMRGNKNSATSSVGVLPSHQEMHNIKLTAGRFFTERENQLRERVVLLGQTVVRNLYGENTNPLGSVIKINRVDFRVIGVLESKGANAFRDVDDRVLIPLTTAMYRVLGKFLFKHLTFAIRDSSEIDIATTQITAYLRDIRKLKSGQENNFDVRSLNEIRETLNKSTQILSSLLAAIAAISLLVGGIGIMNVMLVSVKERTKEIGLRKALGAKARDVMSQFLVESIIIGLLGGVLGIFVGYLLSLVASEVFGWEALFPFSAISLAFCFSVVVGIIFGIWPAKQASELSPIEALRYE